MPPPSQSRSNVLRVLVELLVLRTLALAPMHRWGIAQRLQQIPGGQLEVNQGSLYPPLQRRGLITSDRRFPENHRGARYCEITPAGWRALGEEMDSWRRFAASMEAILRTT